MVQIPLSIGYRVVLERPDKEEISRVEMLCWVIWKMHNDLVWNQKKQYLHEIVVLTEANLNQWIHVSHIWRVCCPRMEKNTRLKI